MMETKVVTEARSSLLTLVAARRNGATVCPSEVARALARNQSDLDWRSYMPAVHDAVDLMVEEGLVQLSWKGVVLPAREGPYRIR